MKLEKILYNPSLRLLIGRVSIAGLVYLGTFSLAAILTAAEYGKVAFTIFITKSVVLSSLGAGQGLIYFLMNDSRDYQKTYLLFSSFSVLVFSTIYFLLYDVSYYLLIFFVAFVGIAEPYLKVRKHFLVSLFPEFFLVFSFLIFFVLSKVFGISNQVLVRPDLYLAVLVFLFAMLYREPLKRFFNESLLVKASVKKLKNLILQGFPSYLFNLVFFLFLLTDRTMVGSVYGDEKLGVVMLAYQLALIAGFVVSAINSKAIIDIGTLMKNRDSRMVPFMIRKITISFSLGLMFLLGILIFVHVLGGRFFSGYEDLIEFVIIYGLGLLVFNIFGSVSPVLFYVRKQIVPAISILISLVALYCSHKFLPSFGFALLEVEWAAYSVFILSLSVSILYCLSKAKTLADSDEIEGTI